MSGLVGNPFLLASAAGGATGYQIERSLRFNSSDSAYLSRTPASAGNRKTWTWAGWVKRAKLGEPQILFVCFVNGSNYSTIEFYSTTDQLRIANVVGGVESAALLTTQVFRDPSSWYHVVVSSNSSTSLKLYVNGVEVTQFAVVTGPSTTDWFYNSTNAHDIGRYSSGYYFNGYLADIHFIDGQALDPTSFTEVDATTGQLVPIAYSGTYGTNGFHLPFSDNSTAAALGTDTSGNGNDWTVNNLYTSSVISLPGVFFGSGNLLTAPSSADFNFGTGDFTVEYFLNRTSLGSNDAAITNYSQVATGYFMCLHSNTTDAYLFLNGSSVTSGGTAEANKWIHYAFVRSGTTCTIYKNGVSIASGTSSAQAGATNVMNIGAYSDGTSFIKGAISNVRIAKGTAVYTSNFTPPSAPLSNITNTVLLCCQSSSSATTAAVSPGAITATGTPTAGTYNDSSPNQDSLVDTPTSYGVDAGVGGEVRGNYVTLNPLDKGSGPTLANGNLDVTGTAGVVRGTMFMPSGKWYFEGTLTALGNSGNNTPRFGVANAAEPIATSDAGSSNNVASIICSPNATFGGRGIRGGTTVGTGNPFAAGDVAMVAYDADTGNIWFGKNGTWINSGNPATGASPTFTGLTAPYAPLAQTDPAGFYCNFGQRPFAYTAPSGFKALCDTNLPAPVVAKPSTVMDVKLYTGNGSTQTISGLGFSPDLVWIKIRSGVGNHRLIDSVRGRALSLSSDATNADSGPSNSDRDLTTFNSDGFSLGINQFCDANASSSTYVAWTWDAGTTTVTLNPGDPGAGSITSQVRANASAGFSVVSFNSGSSGAKTIGHGLNVAPSLLLCKNRDGASNWTVYHSAATNVSQFLMLNSTNGVASSSNIWGSAAPTSTVFGFDSGTNQGANANIICYAFSPVAGYSSFGSYTGNGSADGPFVFCNFRPRWILIKKTDSITVNGNWLLWDTARGSYNVANQLLIPNLANAEDVNASYGIDVVSNGFKLRATGADYNNNSSVYIYAAFAESPFAYARAR